MSFLSSRDRLPLPTVTSAGASRGFNSFNALSYSQRADGFWRLLPPWGFCAAQCLYVLTEENMPVADAVRANFSYASCLLEIAKTRGGVQEVDGKDAAAEERAVSLGILACGASVSDRVWMSFLGVFLIVRTRRYFTQPGAIPASVFHCVGRSR